jgi:hypothetical protein
VVVAVPQGLSYDRHVSLSGRGAHPLARLSLLVVLGVIVVLALLDTFGQHPSTTRVSGGFATLEVQSPSVLRGGLIFQTRITVHARATIAHPTLVLQRDWFESMSVNSMVPDPVQQSAHAGGVSLTFPKLVAGRTSTFWIYFQVNPTNVGRRSEDVLLQGAHGQRIAIHRTVTVMP